MHLIILIHGMWGRTSDFNYIVDQLNTRGYVKYDPRAGSSVETLDNTQLDSAKGIVYCTHSNEGYFTYDGIDNCGVRVADEVSAVISQLGQRDIKIDELSIVGYSMGGLMARYAIGILESRGVFAQSGYAGHPQIKARVFVTTCSPHVGVNVLGRSLGARIFNFIGSWSMARTSRQAFLQDKDQPHQKPLFLYLTQPRTIWANALSRFRRRVLYANITNDRRCEFYTASASSNDPYSGRHLTKLKGPFVSGYEPVVLQSEKPQFENSDAKSDRDSKNGDSIHRDHLKPGFWQQLKAWIVRRSLRLGKLVWISTRIVVVLPLWFCAFLINASYQFCAFKIRTWHPPTLEIQEMLETSADNMVESMHSIVDPEPSVADEAGLPLTPVMRRIVNHFDELGFEKFYLSILTTPMAHAAAIMKHNRLEFYEGKPAVQHLIQILVA